MNLQLVLSISSLVVLLTGCHRTKEGNLPPAATQPPNVPAEVTRRYPIRASFHAHQGNSFLDAGRHVETDITISADGRVDIVWQIKNRVALAGYCFGSAWYFEDSAGNVLDVFKAPRSCVNGTIPGPASRQILLTHQLSKESINRLDHARLVAGPEPGPDRFVETVRKGLGLMKLIEQ